MREFTPAPAVALLVAAFLLTSASALAQDAQGGVDSDSTFNSLGGSASDPRSAPGDISATPQDGRRNPGQDRPGSSTPQPSNRRGGTHSDRSGESPLGAARCAAPGVPVRKSGHGRRRGSSAAGRREDGLRRQSQPARLHGHEGAVQLPGERFPAADVRRRRRGEQPGAPHSANGTVRQDEPLPLPSGGRPAGLSVGPPDAGLGRESGQERCRDDRPAPSRGPGGAHCERDDTGRSPRSEEGLREGGSGHCAGCPRTTRRALRIWRRPSRPIRSSPKHGRPWARPGWAPTTSSEPRKPSPGRLKPTQSSSGLISRSCRWRSCTASGRRSPCCPRST